MRTKKIRTLLVLALLAGAFATVAAIPERPYPQRLVNDLAGVFTASQKAALEQRLVAFDDTTSNQIAVVTLSDLEGQDKAMVAYEIGEKWGVGQQKHNNGIVILIKPKTARANRQLWCRLLPGFVSRGHANNRGLCCTRQPHRRRNWRSWRWLPWSLRLQPRWWQP